MDDYKAPLGNKPAQDNAKKSTPSTFSRVMKYALVRGVTLVLALAVGIYLAVVLVNFGGFVDEIYRDRIAGAIMGMAMAMADKPPEEKFPILEQMEIDMTESFGLNDPFLLRCARWFGEAVTLDWGETKYTTTLRGPKSEEKDTWRVILERLPYTILLFGTATMLLFFSSIFLALYMSRKPGRWMDKLIVALTPISSAPSWIIAMVLVVILGAYIPSSYHIQDVVAQGNLITQIPDLLIYLIIPVLAIILSLFFQNLYTWRSYFMIQSDEYYVENAKAQGLPNSTIDKDHIIRPALPFILTSFALMMITLWQASIALEYFYGWPGIGSLLVNSIWRLERGIVMGIIVIFAYMLGLTVFLLDISYALVDPRVRIGGDNLNIKSVRRRWSIRSHLQRRRKSASLEKKPGIYHTRTPGGFTNYEGDKSKQKRSGIINWSANSRSLIGEIFRSPAAVIGLAIIGVLIAASIYTVIAIPFDDAIKYWRPEQLENYQVPELAQPAWINIFRRDKLPPTIVKNSADGSADKETIQVSEEVTEYNILFRFNYPYPVFPDEVTLYMTADYENKRSLAWITWVQPDGREIDFGDIVVSSSQAYRFDAETRDFPKAMRKGLEYPLHALFANPEADTVDPISGTYELRVKGMSFEEGADFDAELVVLGKVFGLAGSDNRKRDLTVPLLWGIPIALAFGFVGALVASLITVIIAAVSAWYGGWVDSLVQRVTEINMMLPTLAIAITVFFIYSKSVWVILGVFLLLSVFSTSVKNYRAIFIQTREAPYIEAARAYGASNWRMITRYLIPRIRPVLIPQLIILTPTFVFLEATLAYLGVSDPRFPTWGKVILEGITNGGLANGNYHWILGPVVLLIVTGLAFALVGYALDNILNRQSK